MKNFFQFLKKELLFGGHILSLGGVLVAIMYMLVIHKEIDYLSAFGIYLFGQPIFFIDRYIGYREDLEGNEMRTKHINVYRRYIPLFVVFYMLLFMCLMTYFQMYSMLILGIIFFLIGSTYGIFLKKVTKVIPAFKNLFVALFWTIFGFYILFPSSFNYINYAFILFGFYIFLRTLSMQIFFDFKDIKSDSSMKLKTIPVLLGEERAIKVLHILNFLSFILIIIGIFFNIFKFGLIFFLLNHIIAISLYLSLKKSIKYNNFLINMFEYFSMFLIVLIVYG